MKGTPKPKVMRNSGVNPPLTMAQSIQLARRLPVSQVIPPQTLCWFNGHKPNPDACTGYLLQVNRTLKVNKIYVQWRLAERAVKRELLEFLKGDFSIQACPANSHVIHPSCVSYNAQAGYTPLIWKMFTAKQRAAIFTRVWNMNIETGLIKLLGVSLMNGNIVFREMKLERLPE